MSRIPMSDEAPLPWDEKTCEKCGADIADPQLVAHEPELCEDCAPEDDDDELFGTPATRRSTGGAAFTERQREDAEDFS